MFISYRRKDSDIWADRLGEKLREHFPGRVFMDIREIDPGAPWRKVLDQALGDCAALLVVIGPGWVNATDAKGNRRLENPRDTLRREVAEALKGGVRVFPLLVSGADMPEARALPDDLKDLADLQGHDLTVKYWQEDVGRLVAILKRLPELAGDRVADKREDATEFLERLKEGPMPASVWTIDPSTQELPPKKDIAKRFPTINPVPESVGDVLARKRASVGASSMQDGEVPEVPIDGEWVRSRIPAADLPPGSVFRDAPEAPEMVVIPSGKFMMGTRRRHQSPKHRVTIANPFAVGRYEVTFDEWDSFVEAAGFEHTPGDEGWGRGKRPAINVCWDDAKAYVQWLSQHTGRSYRLLSEAEWEYAARAGKTTHYPWGDNAGTNLANFDGSGSQWSGKKTAPVGSFAPNAFGLYDMVGNVWEWVEDCWHGSYSIAPTDGSAWLSGSCDARVIRGGSWNDGYPVLVRLADRGRNLQSDRCNFVGFRLARTLP
jgi:formylglycine-generating enzyme required for sulfatase activity